MTVMFSSYGFVWGEIGACLALHCSPQLAVGCDTSTQGLKAAVVLTVFIIYNKSSFLNFTF